MKPKLVGLVAGIGFGYILSWARLTNPGVIHDMLLLREAHAFLVMASAIAVAFVGIRLVRLTAIRSFGSRIRFGLNILLYRSI